MTKLNHRIWLCDIKEYRKLLNIKRNEYNDLLLEVDGGLVLEFKHNPPLEIPPIERVSILGRMQDSKTKLPSEQASLILQNPRETYFGNIRHIPQTVDNKKTIIEALEEKQIATRGDIEADGHATRATIQNGFDRFMDWGAAFMEKIGLKKRNKRFPRVAMKNQKKAHDFWNRWPLTCIDAQSGVEKIDCFEYYKKQFKDMGINNIDHFKAVLETVRKRP